MNRTLAVSSTWLLLIGACREGTPPSPTHTSAITGPSIDPAWSLHPAVGQLHWSLFDLRPNCTATLVTPRIALSAGHCFDNVFDDTEGPPPGTLSFAVHDQTGAVLDEVAVTRIRLFTRQAGRRDLALILLERAITAATPIPIAPDPALAGASVIALGYGCNAEISTSNTGVKRGKVHAWSTVRDPDTGAVVDDGFRPCLLDSGGPVLGAWDTADARVVGVVSFALGGSSWETITSALLADTAASCSAINAAASAWVVGSRPCPSAEVDPCAGVTVPLSPVGAAIAGVAGLSGKLARCAAVPARWLYNIDGIDDTDADLFQLGHDQLPLTTSSFSHAALNDHTFRYNFADAIRQLHVNIATLRGTPVADADKPIVRFYFGDATLDIADTYQRLIADLVTLAGPDPASWNVKVAVAQSSSLLTGWNHSKLTVRDRSDAIATSYETDEHELAIRLAGPAAEHAQAWFDVNWTQVHTSCISSGSLCGQIPRAPLGAAPTLLPFRPLNVFALERGQLDTGFDTQADDALLAGMDAATQSIFILDPGLVGYLPGYTTVFSPILVNKIADRLAAGVDVKLVWGSPAFPLTAENWQNIEATIDRRFDVLGLGPTQKAMAHCMFHVVSYTDPRPQARTPSHAKFYMLDRSFYIGSQNLYPSEFKGEAVTPELKDFGFLVDTRPEAGDPLASELVSRVVDPIWDRSKLVVAQSNYASCGALPHLARLVGTAETQSGVFTCASDFELSLDYQRVEHGQVAAVTGSTTCSSSGFTVLVGVEGVIQAGGRFAGTITGSLPGVTGDTASLNGTLSNGVLALTFSDLEPIQGVPYHGTVSTRSTACDGRSLGTCGGTCSWYWCANEGAGACFPTGTPTEQACPPSDPGVCATITAPAACAGGCAWYWCAAGGAGECFPRGTPTDAVCPQPGG